MLNVSVRRKMGEEALLRQQATLRQSVDAFCDFEDDCTITEIFLEMIGSDGRGGHELLTNFEIFGSKERSTKIIIRDVDRELICVVRKHRVKQDLDDINISCASFNGAKKIDTVSTNSAADAIRFATGSITFFFRLRIVVHCVGAAISRLVFKMNRPYCV